RREIDEIADGGDVVVIQIAAGPDAGRVEVGGEIDEVADAHVVVEVQVADQRGADDDRAAGENTRDGEVAGVGGNDAGGEACAAPQAARAIVAGVADVRADGAEDRGILDFQPPIVHINHSGRID